MSRFIKAIANAAIVCLCLGAPIAAAEGVLPPAYGKHSLAFVIPPTAAPFAAGARVEFIGQKDNDVPKRLMIFGFVLGMNDNVAFVELSERDAVRLMQAKQSQTVKVVKIDDPDPGLVADRRALAEETVPIQVSWHMRTLTVRIAVSGEELSAWERGDTLIFDRVDRTGHLRFVKGYTSKTGDVTGIFLSATAAGDGAFDVRLLADPADAAAILTAEATDQLRAAREGEERLVLPKRDRCFVRRRQGVESIRIEIPCS